jgi:hypothetical protein
MHSNIPGLGFVLVPSSANHAPSRIGRHDSTIRMKGQLHYLAGPASLLNASCEDCSNCQLKCSNQRVRTSDVIAKDVELLIVYGFDTYRPDMKCPICACEITDSDTINFELPPLPSKPEFVRVDEDPSDPDVRWCALERERKKKKKALNLLMDNIDCRYSVSPFYSRLIKQKKHS